MRGPSAQELIRQLDLRRHPEGGWFRETYRSALSIAAAALPEIFDGERHACTAIFYLLEQGDISALHRIKSDELWHFYAGAPVNIHVIEPAGVYALRSLGSDGAAGETFQAIVPAGCWFGAEIAAAGEYSLVGCTVAPGFDFTDFEMGDRQTLLRLYPQHGDIIRRLAKAGSQG